LQGSRASQARNEQEVGSKQSSLLAGFLLALFFDPKNGEIFLRNVGYLSTEYTVL
jgi:hypothetical protein